MFFIREPAFSKKMTEHSKRIVKRLVSLKWVYKNKNGNWRTILHDIMNLPVEAARLDPYFAGHWFMVQFALWLVSLGVIWWLVG